MLTVTQLVKKFPAKMTTTNQPATGLYPDPDESIRGPV